VRLLSTHELADAIGVSESSLKRWIDAGRISASRTEGGHRRVLLGEAMRFIRDQRAPIVRPELLGLPEIGVDRSRGEQLITYLLEGNRDAARGFLAARYLAGATVASLADGPIREAMHGLGELWRHDEAGIFVEHRGTEICLHAISALRALMSSIRADVSTAIGGAPTGDPYLLPSLLASLAVAEAGLDAVNLGADTPLAAFDAAIAAHAPRLVWMSITTTPTCALARSLASWFESVPGDVTIVVGGQHANDLDRVPARVRRIASMAQLADLAAMSVAARPRARVARRTR
jgi:excisionase family DNA binding protein